MPSLPLLIEMPTLEACRRTIPAYRRILLETLDVIIERCERHSSYPFIDTKIDLLSGGDVRRCVGGTDIFGRDTVYTWIQSRGVEALCGHARWIETLPDMTPARQQHYQSAIRRIVERVIGVLESARRRNGGSLFFWMDTEGRPFTLEANGSKHALSLDPAYAYGSDMFHVKAVAAAADLLDDRSLRQEAEQYFARWIAAIKNDTVHSDQQPFDPKNPVAPTPGRRSHGLRMITLGSLARYARLIGHPSYIDDGLAFIRYILDHHVNLNGHFRDLAPYDFIEFIDANGAPYRQDGHSVCDPGHALEFVGLGFKFLNAIRERSTLTAQQKQAIAECDRLLPLILQHVFHQGYNPKGGIFKLIALESGRPLNTDMPWWNLPETMRAALFCHQALKDTATRTACLNIFRLCSNAFMRHYIVPEQHCLAYQTLNVNAQPIPVIPATPDLDPGYHTGLSIIDAMEVLDTDTRTTRCHETSKDTP